MYLGTLLDFKEDCISNDFNFMYRGVEYWLTFDRGKFVAGECMTDEELFHSWTIDGKLLKEIEKV